MGDRSGRRSRLAILIEGARLLFPGYFALVMATGVISIACQLLGMRTIALSLVAFNWIAYPVLWTLTLIRVVRFPTLLMLDVFNHQRAPGFFTLVAGTCVLGTQNVIVLEARGVATALWWLGVGLWFIVM